MRTAAILPVKRFTEAKRRLGASGVADPLRADLARAMVGDVLVALRAARSLERVIVVTNEEAVAAAARYQGALAVADTAEQGQSAAVALGVERALTEGFERVLCVPGDCPALDPAEIDALVGAVDAPRGGERRGVERRGGKQHGVEQNGGKRRGVEERSGEQRGAERRGVERRGGPDEGRHSASHRHGAPRREVVIVPDRHGSGTNGLLLSPPDAIAPSFGPDSCERHRGLARAAGAACLIERPASLLLDVDTREDLEALRERLDHFETRASRTRAVLGRRPSNGPGHPVARSPTAAG